jgi:hypothetical protein
MPGYVISLKTDANSILLVEFILWMNKPHNIYPACSVTKVHRFRDS